MLRIYWIGYHAAARLIALLLMVGSLVGAVLLALDGDSRMDASLRWGLVVLLSLIGIICLLALRAPVRREGDSSRHVFRLL